MKRTKGKGKKSEETNELRLMDGSKKRVGVCICRRA